MLMDEQRAATTGKKCFVCAVAIGAGTGEFSLRCVQQILHSQRKRREQAIHHHRFCCCFVVSSLALLSLLLLLLSSTLAPQTNKHREQADRVHSVFIGNKANLQASHICVLLFCSQPTAPASTRIEAGVSSVLFWGLFWFYFPGLMGRKRKTLHQPF